MKLVSFPLYPLGWQNSGSHSISSANTKEKRTLLAGNNGLKYKRIIDVPSYIYYSKLKEKKLHSSAAISAFQQVLTKNKILIHVHNKKVLNYNCVLQYQCSPISAACLCMCLFNLHFPFILPLTNFQLFSFSTGDSTGKRLHTNILSALSLVASKGSLLWVPSVLLLLCSAAVKK